MSDDLWKTTFKIIMRREQHEDGDLGSTTVEYWDILNIHNNVVVGSYRSSSYATKQARRKYKKLVKLLEKSFMSLV